MRRIVPPPSATGVTPMGLGLPAHAPPGASPLGPAVRSTVAPASQRMSPEAYNAYGDAKNILAVAEKEAERIRQEAERLRDEQARAGYQEGYRKGYEEALKGLAKLERDYTQALDRLEPEAVQLSVRIAEKILGEEMRLHPDTIVGIVQQALRMVRHQKEIVIRVHPEHKDELEAKKATLFGVLSRAREVRINADETVRPGGCIIETELGVLDADVRTQLTEIEKALRGA